MKLMLKGTNPPDILNPYFSPFYSREPQEYTDKLWKEQNFYNVKSQRILNSLTDLKNSLETLDKEKCIFYSGQFHDYRSFIFVDVMLGTPFIQPNFTYNIYFSP